MSVERRANQTAASLGSALREDGWDMEDGWEDGWDMQMSGT